MLSKRLRKLKLDEKSKLNNTELDNSECEKDLGLLVSSYLKSRKHRINVRNKVNSILWFMSRSVSDRTADVFFK